MSGELDPAALREIASAATEGPWEVHPQGLYVYTGDHGMVLSLCSDNSADMVHAAAFDPPTALALLDHLDHLRDRAQQAEIQAAAMEERAVAAEAKVAQAGNDAARPEIDPVVMLRDFKTPRNERGPSHE